MKLKIGDRVIAVADVGHHDVTGVTGTIKELDNDYDNYGVEFDTNIEGHDLDGDCQYGYGWYCDEDEIALVDQALLSLSDAYDALRDGKRVREAKDGYEVVLNEYNQLRWSLDAGGQEVPITKNTLRPGYFEIFDEHLNSVPEITKYDSYSYSIRLDTNDCNLICIDTLDEIKDSVNDTEASMIRLYKTEGFDFRIEEDHECYQVYLTHSEGGQK